MDFYKACDQVVALLQLQSKGVTYCALKRQFGLEDTCPAGLQDEMIEARQQTIGA